MSGAALFLPALESLNTAYALLDRELTIAEYSQSAAGWLASAGEALDGASLWDVVPELIGYEDDLAALTFGGAPFRLDNINRPTRAGELRYCSLVLTALDATRILLLITDTTATGLLLQLATQRRNELQLVRQELARLNGQLDFVLRNYLAPDVAAALLSGELRPALGGEVREISILFADVRNFTPLSERLDPSSLMHLLNGYLTAAIGALERAGGTLVQIQGDAIMALFNAPRPQPAHAQLAAEAAKAIQVAVADEARRTADTHPPLGFGIGINTGMALVGNSGAPWHMVYTANGDSVNLAARITGAAPAGAIWLSDSTAKRLDAHMPRRPLPPLQFKGKSDPTSLWELC